MSFPVSPTNGQQSTIANIVYQYASATNSWTVVPGYANAITATGNIAAANLLSSGLLNVTGNIYTGNILTNGYYYANGVAFSGGGGGGGGNGIVYTANTIPPAAGNTVGSQWYNTNTGALFEFQYDGTSTYWVDVTGPTVANGSVTISTSSDGLSPFLLMGA